MSNYTYTTYTPPATQRIQQQSEATDAASLRRRIDDLTRANGTLQTNLENANDRAAAANRKYEQALADLRSQNDAAAARNAQLQQRIEEVYVDCNNRIAANTAQMQENLDQLRGDIGNYVTRSIEANNEVIQGLINQNNDTITAMITSLQNDAFEAIRNLDTKLDDVATNVDLLIGGANDLLDTAMDLMDRVDDLDHQIAATRHELLLPGRYAAVQALASTARNDITLALANPMNSPNAYDNTRTAFEETFRFFEEVRVAEQEWLAQLASAEQIASLLEEQFESSRQIEPKPGIKLDVDYWSNDEFSANLATFRDLQRRLKNPENLTTEQLIDLQNSFQMLSSNLDGVVANAWTAANTSQRVARTAERIRRHLEQDGYLLVISHSYEGDDQRGNYRFVVSNPNTRTNVVITVSVTGQGDDWAITSEGDITDYGTMSASAAEEMVRNAIGSIVTGADGNPSVTCQSPGQILHPGRENMHGWKNPAHPTNNPANN